MPTVVTNKIITMDRMIDILYFDKEKICSLENVLN